MKVSVVIPTLNEESGIGVTLDSINREAFAERHLDLEVIIVDGNSTDKTREIARAKGAQVIVEPRRGYGRAYKTGFSQASGDLIVTGDADGTYPFHLAHEYVDLLLNEGLDFITTNRFANLGAGSMSAKHFLGNFILSATLRLLYGVAVKDSQSGMWIFRKQALDQVKDLEAFNDGMPFSEEMKLEMFRSPQVKAREIPSHLYQRKGEAKIQSFNDGWKNLKFLLCHKWR
ncbi:MAG: glycosyltransferase family 2 protein [Candidatus Thermoplasmatota archaeon]|nr:glycosyltransferase family 2 protein [Candidatus Thermoplasmatota archaeon]MDD5779240.1 glycosyltransferase family 2 protein [Candidatus Thermoplasmatota archaeon]